MFSSRRLEGGDVPHQEDAVVRERAGDGGERAGGPGQVVDDVERRDQVVGAGQFGAVAELEVGVVQAPLGGLGARGGDAVRRQVQAAAAAGGKALARTLTAWPCPVPMSSVSIPACSRSVRPGTSGTIPSTRARSKTSPDSSAWRAWNRGYAE